MYNFLLALHLLAAIVWIGGMVFCYFFLAPASETLGDSQRLTLWRNVFKRFFSWVWVSVVMLLGTGFVMIALLGGFTNLGVHIYTMMTLGILMMAIFKFVYVAPYKHLCRGVDEQKWEVAAFALGTIRKLVAINLILAALVVLSVTIIKDFTWI